MTKTRSSSHYPGKPPASKVARTPGALYCVRPMIFFRPARRGFAFALLVAGLVGTRPVLAQKPRPPAKPNAPAASGSPAPSPGTAPYVLPEVVATVDGEPVKKQDLERVVQAVVGSGGRNMQDLLPGEKHEAYESLLNTIIIDRLVSKQAIGETVSDLDVESRFGDLMKQYPTPLAFKEQVKKAGETEAHIKTNIRGQLAQQQWLQKRIADDIKVTPQEVEKFYRESPPNKFDEPEIIRARHLLVAVRKDAPPEDAVEAEDKVKALLVRVKQGESNKTESFEAVARQQSDDLAARDTPATATAPAKPGNGGDLGWFTRDRIMPEFGDVAFRLKPGEIGGPVRTQFGFHLIQLVDRKPARTASLDEARDQIAAYIQGEKRQAAIGRLVAGLRTQAKVQSFLP